ncbi:hypothetical protein D1815_20495 [Aquimarina sp. AD1]|uniref:hypothetical protein n=2 Tax=Aquimarina TaxID=290174 RepID=UPI000E512C8B|nr:hypothetical protein [Aquimarina sp. AD1]AXT58018.1 hypothetical protein D1815_20495 [Aquimarina sp. AD1]RKN03508.1 hypothetical protein D7035_22265 [Aquimarina sp. AD1]
MFENKYTHKIMFIIVLFLLCKEINAQEYKNITYPTDIGNYLFSFDEQTNVVFYVNSKNKIFDKEGNQIKNPNQIREIIKENIGVIDKVYLHSDAVANYDIVNLVKTFVAKEGIKNIVYVTSPASVTEMGSGVLGTLPIKIEDKKQYKDVIHKVNSEDTKNYRFKNLILLNNEFVFLGNKKIKIKSRVYKRLWDKTDFLNVNFHENLNYNDYVAWLCTNNSIKLSRKLRYKKNPIVLEQMSVISNSKNGEKQTFIINTNLNFP